MVDLAQRLFVGLVHFSELLIKNYRTNYSRLTQAKLPTEAKGVFKKNNDVCKYSFKNKIDRFLYI